MKLESVHLVGTVQVSGESLGRDRFHARDGFVVELVGQLVAISRGDWSVLVPQWRVHEGNIAPPPADSAPGVEVAPLDEAAALEVVALAGDEDSAATRAVEDATPERPRRRAGSAAQAEALPTSVPTATRSEPAEPAATCDASQPTKPRKRRRRVVEPPDDEGG